MRTPAVGLSKFNCPYCHALAQQSWAEAYIRPLTDNATDRFNDERRNALLYSPDPDANRGKMAITSETGIHASIKLIPLKVGQCVACGLRTLWLDGYLLFPASTSAPEPSPDLPEVAGKDFAEAARVLSISPRAAAALLRLSLEKLCGHLLGKDDTIDKMIAEFVALGVPPQIQQAMDILRVTGNEAVHPGTMDAVDDEATARSLFGLVNLIVDVMITQPRHVADMYQGLPEAKREAIERRNAKALPAPDNKVSRETLPSDQAR